ncbi:SAICAR synthase-like protein, partial [Aureobasidium melanogenum]
MGSRDEYISRSIVLAVLQGDRADSGFRFWHWLRKIFALYALVLTRFRPDLFQRLRNQTWKISEDDYKASFQGENPLIPKGDMGYSGSTFFTTKDNKYLIKSVPRRFEHTFFRDDLLEPYVAHMESHPQSLLVRITDFLGWKYHSLGGLLGVAPNYHLVMENLLHGQDEDSNWQTFDLKPMSYFFPERDIAGGKLASQATKSKLADEFNDKMRLSQSQADAFLEALQADTELLARHNAVDYSLMLVRIPRPSTIPASSDDPFRDPEPLDWRTGVPSQDGKWLYRALILDFFWAKHKVRAKLMTLLVDAWNLIDRKGPMSITTTAPEYRGRFLDMCRAIVQVEGGGPESSTSRRSRSSS